MDAFETIVASTLEGIGYWTRTTYKVELTREEKRAIQRPSSPRWEIDVVAFKPAANELLIVECKSYLDSPGVKRDHFEDSVEPTKKPYKLFNEERLYDVVSAALVAQLKKAGLVGRAPTVRLCLAAGHIATEQDRRMLHELFDKRGWLLWDEFWFKEKLTALSQSKYENAIAAVVAKLLLRPQR